MSTATLNASLLETWLSAAVAAPSVHNTQPWSFRLDVDTPALEVRAAPERGLPELDPAGRALHLSVGAAVFNLRVAVAHSGWLPVTRLLPRPTDPALLASVRPAPGGKGERTHRADLFDVIWSRHSSRFPFSEHPVPADVRAELVEAAHAGGAALTFLGPVERAHVLRLSAEGERRNSADAVRGAESRRWVRWPGGGAPADDLGMPRETLGPQDARGRLPMRDFTAERHRERLPAQNFERAPAIAVLSTPHDRRADWLRAGQALEHVLLVATAHGLRSSLLHQALEWTDLGRRISPASGTRDHVHMVIRLGYGPTGPITPRRTGVFEG
ncbi:Acg family FMN-binding oxidoreductase [Streptomyces sp. WG-D5]